MQIASRTTGAAGTSRYVRKYTAAAARNDTTPTKNTRRPSRSRSRRARTTRKNSYAAALYSFHFYGHDDYRGDLRKALVIMEELVETFSLVYGPNHNRTMSVVSNLRAARQVQLDWRVDDLTPATIASFGMAKLTIPEKAATLYAIEQLSSSASALEIREYAERCLGAPQGYLDAKKAAIDDLWREAQSG